MNEKVNPEKEQDSKPALTPASQSPAPKPGEGEIGGPKGPEPTRYGDWEVNGICSDF